MNVHEGVFQYPVQAQNWEDPVRSTTIPDRHLGHSGGGDSQSGFVHATPVPSGWTVVSRQVV